MQIHNEIRPHVVVQQANSNRSLFLFIRCTIENLLLCYHSVFAYFNISSVEGLEEHMKTDPFYNRFDPEEKCK